jgi:hypothetical protein
MSYTRALTFENEPQDAAKYGAIAGPRGRGSGRSSTSAGAHGEQARRGAGQRGGQQLQWPSYRDDGSSYTLVGGARASRGGPGGRRGVEDRRPPPGSSVLDMERKWGWVKRGLEGYGRREGGYRQGEYERERARAPREGGYREGEYERDGGGGGFGAPARAQAGFSSRNVRREPDAREQIHKQVMVEAAHAAPAAAKGTLVQATEAAVTGPHSRLARLGINTGEGDRWGDTDASSSRRASV